MDHSIENFIGCAAIIIIKTVIYKVRVRVRLMTTLRSYKVAVKPMTVSLPGDEPYRNSIINYCRKLIIECLRVLKTDRGETDDKQ